MNKESLIGRLKKWLFKDDIERMEWYFTRRKDELERDYADRKNSLEIQYAQIRRYNDYVTNLMIETQNLNPKPVVFNVNVPAEEWRENSRGDCD